MSTQYGRLAEARDKARPIAPDETVEVYAADLDVILAHYAKLIDELAFTRAPLNARAYEIADRAAQELVETEGVKTDGIDEYRFDANELAGDTHMTDCIAHLCWRGLAVSCESGDMVFVQLDNSTIGT